MTDYFRRSVLEDPDRSDITVEMCERVVAEAEYNQQQSNGLWRIWGYIPKLDQLHPGRNQRGSRVVDKRLQGQELHSREETGKQVKG